MRSSFPVSSSLPLLIYLISIHPRFSSSSLAPALIISTQCDTSDSTLRPRFTTQTLAEFCLGVEQEYAAIGQRAVHIILPFATSYLCEIGFSAVAALKTKYRSQLMF